MKHTTFPNPDSQSVTKLFSSFGKVKSVRLRSMPVVGTAVDDAGNQTLVRKVCAMKRKFSDAKDSVNAYVVFESHASVEAAVSGAKAEPMVAGTHHLRVDYATPRAGSLDAGRSVFLGNLPWDAGEEQLRAHFVNALDGAVEEDAIESIRLIRDAMTQAGKGFGYLLLKDKATVAKVRARWQMEPHAFISVHF